MANKCKCDVCLDCIKLRDENLALRDMLDMKFQEIDQYQAELGRIYRGLSEITGSATMTIDEFMEAFRSKGLYEGHITFNHHDSEVDKEKLEAFIESIPGAKYSYINNDPVLGKKPFTYLTMYGSDRVALSEELEKIALDAHLKSHHVVRVKVEQIVYDRKTE